MYKWGVLIGSLVTFSGILGNEIAKANDPSLTPSSIAVGVGVVGIVIQVASLWLWRRNQP
jgi:hypothetical protein